MSERCGFGLTSVFRCFLDPQVDCPRTLISATENGDLIVYRHELDWMFQPISPGAPSGHTYATRRDAPWQFRFFMAAFSGFVWSLPVYQNTSRHFSEPFPSALSFVYILCTTSSFVPPWNGIISPWSLKPRSRYNVTWTPRLQASRTLETIGEALNVGVWLCMRRLSIHSPRATKEHGTYMKTLF